MMGKLIINQSDIGEEVIYNWTCPSCGNNNEESEEPIGDDELQCESCGASITVIDN